MNDVESTTAADSLAAPVVPTGAKPQSAFSTLRTSVSQWIASERGLLVLRGGAWSIIGYVSTQLLRTVATLVLARHFLGPEPFGLVGLVAVFLAGLNMFSELGILANIVQHPRGDEPKFLNTAFSIQAGRGVLIWIASLAAAYPLAVFYKQRELLPLLAVAGLSELLRGLTSTAAWTLTRHVQLRNITLLTIGSELIAAIFGIGWAMVSPSAWALVARTVASAGLYAAGSYLIVRQKVRFGWDREAAKDILHFGTWVSIATATYFLGGQGERLVLGKFVTPAELGCFSLALMVSSVPAGGIGQIVNQILLPLISNTARNSREQTIREFGRVRRIFMAVSLVAGFGFLLLGKPFVAVLLPPKYAMAGWMLQILGLRVALDVFAAPVSSLLMAYGQTKYSAGANTTRFVLMIGGVWAAIAFFGIRHAVISLVLAQAIAYFPLVLGLGRVVPEVKRLEMRAYALFLLILAVAGFVFRPV